MSMYNNKVIKYKIESIYLYNIIYTIIDNYI